MKTLGIAPIVEGHGEQESIRILLTRTVAELLGAPYPWVLPPIGSPYSPPIDQPRLTAAMDLTMCRAGSRSYDKLCRELERRLRA